MKPHLEQEIEMLRKELVAEVSKAGVFLNEKVIELSKELDLYILSYLQEYGAKHKQAVGY